MKKTKMIKVSEEILKNGTKIVVLGDKETKGSSAALAIVNLGKTTNA